MCSDHMSQLSLLDLDEDEEKEQLKELQEKFQPLLDYLKKEAQEVVRDGRSPLA